MKSLIFSFFVSTKFQVVITFSLIWLIKKCNIFCIWYAKKNRFCNFDKSVRHWNSISKQIKNVKFDYFLVPLLIVAMAESISIINSSKWHFSIVIHQLYHQCTGSVTILIRYDPPKMADLETAIWIQRSYNVFLADMVTVMVVTCS